jgi:hypothetical protein
VGGLIVQKRYGKRVLVRARIEKIFGTWKRSYRFRAMRWTGLAKARLQVHLASKLPSAKPRANALLPLSRRFKGRGDPKTGARSLPLKFGKMRTFLRPVSFPVKHFQIRGGESATNATAFLTPAAPECQLRLR